MNEHIISFFFPNIPQVVYTSSPKQSHKWLYQ